MLVELRTLKLLQFDVSLVFVSEDDATEEVSVR